MIKSIGKLTLATILAALVVGVPLAAPAQATPPATSSATPSKRPTVFRLTPITAVDKAAKTITLGDKAKHTLEVTSNSKITLDKKPATLDDIAVGQKASGSFTKGADGKFSLRTLHARTDAAVAK